MVDRKFVFINIILSILDGDIIFYHEMDSMVNFIYPIYRQNTRTTINQVKYKHRETGKCSFSNIQLGRNFLLIQSQFPMSLGVQGKNMEKQKYKTNNMELM